MSTALAAALPEIVALVERTAREHHCPSVAWGIVIDGALAAHGSTGTLEDGSTPTAQTVYRIASMTKSFTAAAMLSLRDQGLLALDDTLARHAPEFAHLRAPATDAAPIRLRDLLSMSSGLANDDPWADRHMDLDGDELERAVANGALFAGATGEVFEYSNLGYGLLGRVVHNLTGQSLQDCVNERLLVPLGMTRTTWTAPAHDDWARPFREQDGQCLPEGGPIPDDGALAPMGGLWSTVADLARWVAWFDGAFGADGERAAHRGWQLPRAATRREMQQMQRYIGMHRHGAVNAPGGYGFGLTVRDDPALGGMVAHSGGLPGYGSNMRWLADAPGGARTGRRVGAIALANITYAPMAELTYEMFTLMRAHDVITPPTHAQAAPDTVIAHAAHALVKLLADWDDAAAAALFSDNVALDERFDRRRDAALRLRDRCGGSLRIARILVISATSAEVELATTTGDTPVVLALQLAPFLPARVQHYSVR